MFYTIKLTQSIYLYDPDTKKKEVILLNNHKEGFKSIKEKFKANMKLLDSISNTEISNYDKNIQQMEDIRRVEFA